jgi:diguanylate cyclase (GGDEF)-like protein
MSTPRVSQYKDDLYRLTFVIGAALAFFGIALLGVVAYAGWSANQQAIERERQLVENALDQAVSGVLDEQKAIAWWDDAVINAQMRPLDIEWIETNFGVYFYETYGHDEFYLIDGDDQPVYANIAGEMQEDPSAMFTARANVVLDVVHGARGDRSLSLRIRDGAFTVDQQRYSFLLGGRDAGWSGQILTIDGEPAVVAVMAIVPSVDATVLEGRPHLMVSVVRIDEDFLDRVGRTLLIPDLALSATARADAGRIAEPFLDDSGAPIGYLSWTPKRPGQALLLFVLPMVALGILIAGLFTQVMLRRLKRASGELADREEQARFQALHDALSGLPNRRSFGDQLQAALDDLVQSRANRRVIVAYVDVDRFKDVNDTMGHHTGDTLIMAVAERLGRAIGHGDFLSRFGGDEFAVMRVSSDPDAVDQLLVALRSAFEDPFAIGGQNIRMTASIGVSMAPDHGGAPDELMRHADIALYEAKDNGRDCAMMFSAKMASEVERRRAIELDLQDALARDALDLHYQPLVSCKDGRVTAVEALLRWRHSELGDISPGVFVPIAEETGLMPALGAWVVERAFMDAQRWPTLEISVNLSPVQFRHVDLPAFLASMLARHPVDPHRIVLEVTEGVLMEPTQRNRDMLDEIRAMGFKIALDDFGTGYSSLRYLSDFRFEKIKIDRAFVTDVNERKRAMTIIQSVVTLGRGLHMDIVAEGVETEAEATAMRLLGVTELQGYFFARPMPRDDVSAFVAKMERASLEARATGESKPARRLRNSPPGDVRTREIDRSDL